VSSVWTIGKGRKEDKVNEGGVGMFSVALVLSKEDLGVLVSNFVEVFKDEADMKADQLVEFLSVVFEELLDEYGVDRVIVKLGEVYREVDSSEEFMDLVKEVYGDLALVLTLEGEAKVEDGSDIEQAEQAVEGK
jgi:hypothetical protein